MKLQGRNLSIEMQDEVKVLQSELKLLDPFIADNKLNDWLGIRNGFHYLLKIKGR